MAKNPVILLLACAVLAGCAGRGTEPRAGGEDPIVSERRQKDLAFKSGSESPIPEADRAGFEGLSYYPVDPGLRFRVRLRRYERPERLRLATNTGEMRDAIKYGYFEFEVDGEACRLQVYRTEGGGQAGTPYLFIPFRDLTSGRETYGAGRYLDLKENTSGVYELDFNRAYNPLCAYGGSYSCPLPPEENRLPVAIRAGERGGQATVLPSKARPR